MKLLVLVRHTFDNHTYDVGDSYEVADDLCLDGSPVTVAETIIGNGMARRDDAPAAAPAPPAQAAPPARDETPPPAPPHVTARHRKA
jgi:hypothetical protein